VYGCLVAIVWFETPEELLGSTAIGGAQPIVHVLARHVTTFIDGLVSIVSQNKFNVVGDNIVIKGVAMPSFDAREQTALSDF